MFAYCGNNPVTREDSSGNFWNLIGGAVVGAIIGAASQAISNVIEGKPITDGLAQAAVTGAIDGVLTTAFPGSSTLISVGMSVAESVISDIQNEENLCTILVNATISAGFGAIASEGTVFSDNKFISNTIGAIGKVLPGNHPSVKKAAKKVLKAAGKMIWSEISSGVTEELVVNYTKKGAKFLSGLYTGSKSTYELFA